jgi:hypothetical protein
MAFRRLAGCLASIMLLANVGAADASAPVVVDDAGDARPQRCTVACTSVGPGESQPAADILRVDVVPDGRELGIEVMFLDIDREIPLMGPEQGIIWDSVSFMVKSTTSWRWTSVRLEAQRGFTGEPADTTVKVRVGTMGSDDPDRTSRDLTGVASVDPASNRLRLAVSLDELQRALDELCDECGSFAPGSTLESFLATSNAWRTVSAGVPLTGVDDNVATDTGWPTATYTL